MMVDIVLGEKFKHIWSVDKVYTKIAALCERRSIDVKFIHFPPAPHWLNYVRYDNNWSAVTIRRYALCKYYAKRVARKGAVTHISHNYAAYTKSFGKNFPSVVHIQDTILEQDYGQLGRRRYKYLNDGFANLDAIVVSTDYVRNKVIDTFPCIDESKLVKVHPGVDYESLHQYPREEAKIEMEDVFGIPADMNYVLCFGADSYRKNITGALRAFEHAASSRDDIVFLKAGASHVPEERDYVDTHLTRSKYADRVYRLHEVPPDYINIMYSGAACSLFPSLDEGYGLPPLEAAACGCPCITSDTTSIPEILGPEYPKEWVHSAYDPIGMGNSIVSILEDRPRAEYLVRKASTYQRKLHDINRSVDQLVSLWERLHENAKPLSP